MQKLLIALYCAAFVLPASAMAAGEINLDDCDVLVGKTHVSEYRKIMADQRTRADHGDFKAKELLAGVANNRFACIAESLGGEGTGWSATLSSTDEQGRESVTSTNTKLVSSALIRKNPQAIEALRDAYGRAQDLSDADPAYRNSAAQFVVDYSDLFAREDYERAYRNAAGVLALTCSYPTVLGKGRSEAFCRSAKGQLVALHIRLAKAQRDSDADAGRIWAEQYMADHRHRN